MKSIYSILQLEDDNILKEFINIFEDNSEDILHNDEYIKIVKFLYINNKYTIFEKFLNCKLSSLIFKENKELLDIIRTNTNHDNVDFLKLLFKNNLFKNSEEDQIQKNLYIYSKLDSLMELIKIENKIDTKFLKFFLLNKNKKSDYLLKKLLDLDLFYKEIKNTEDILLIANDEYTNIITQKILQNNINKF